MKQVKWKEAAGNSRYDSTFGKWQQVLWESLLTWSCMLLNLLSARIMLADVFVWGQFEPADLFLTARVLLFVTVLFEVTFLFPYLLGTLSRFVIFGAGVSYFVHELFFDINSEYYMSGLQSVFSSVVKEINNYLERILRCYREMQVRFRKP